MKTYCSCTGGREGGGAVSAGRTWWPAVEQLPGFRTEAHLGLDHGQAVRTHLRHHPQNIHKLVFSDVLHQTIQSDEGSRPSHSGTADTRNTLSPS